MLLRIEIALWILLIGGFFAFWSTESVVNHYIDPVTGSKRTVTKVAGFTYREEIRESQLEHWFRSHKNSRPHVWVCTSQQGYTLFGRKIWTGSGRIPPMYRFKVEKEFLERAADEEVLRFLNVMTTGKEAAQQDLIDSITTEVLSRT